MKDLGARRNLLGLLLLLATLAGCQALDASKPSKQQPTNGNLALSEGSLDFGNVAVGSSKTLTLTLVNGTSSDINLTGAEASGPDFSLSTPQLPVTIPAGQRSDLSFTFRPKNTGNSRATISISTSAALDPLSLSVVGDAVPPGQLESKPASIDFGVVAVDGTLTKPAVVTNIGSSSLTISQVSVSGAGFQLADVNLPRTLDPGQSLNLSVTFAPLSGGMASGAVSVTTTDTGNGIHRQRSRNGKIAPRDGTLLTIPLAGIGASAGQLSLTPASVAFGDVTVGSAQNQPVTLTNVGGTSVTVTQAVASGPGFGVSGLTLPVVLAAGASTGFTVSFNPQATGDATGNVSLVSDANSPLVLPLSGTGVAAGLLNATPSSVDFGTVQVGKDQNQSITLKNNGGTSLRISQARVSGTGFSITGLSLPLTLEPGASTVFTAKFAPNSPGSARGNISVINNGSNPKVDILLSATAVSAGALVADPSSFNFGNVQVGSRQTLPGTLINTGGTDVVISQANVTGAGLSVGDITLPLTLGPGQRTTFSVTFAPQAGGAVNGNVAILNDGANPTLNVPVLGTGVTAGLLTAKPVSIDFGTVQVGKNQPQPETITNTGGTQVVISQANVTGSGFSISGITLPLTLNPGQNKVFTVTFAPQAAGVVSGNLAVVSDGSNPTLNIPLTGTGIAAGFLSADPSSLSFGNVQVGKNQSLPETITNTGGADVVVTQANVSGAGLSISGLDLPLTLTSGQNKTFTVTFAPQSAGTVNGNIAIVSNGSNPTLNVPLSGTGVAAGFVSPNPPSIDFGTVQVGKNSTQPETLTNTGGVNVTISQATVSGTGFTISGLNLPATLTPGQGVTFEVTFTPTSGGTFNGNIAVVSDGSNPNLNIPLSGTAKVAGQLGVAPTSQDFGNVTVGQHKDLIGTLTATGASVTVTSYSIDSNEFTLSGLTFPFTLGVGQGVPFTITFTPQMSGNAVSAVSFASDASNSPTIESLSGTGVAAPQHSVDLSWNASQSSGVVGYNVYRGAQTGGPYAKINSALDATTTYTDNSVLSGQTYYYVSTAVDGGGVESVYSNEVQAVIPNP